MREILFRGKRIDNGEWVEGSLAIVKDGCIIIPIYAEAWSVCEFNLAYYVDPSTVGQYTGMHEFVMTDKSINAPLFGGDIVEVWSRRRPLCEPIWNKPQSQYDIQVKARATIVFHHGKWKFDYDNNYNKSLCKLRGKEEDERTVNAGRELYDYGHHGNNEDWHREHNSHYKWDDIIKIGNKFDNPELLE